MRHALYEATEHVKTCNRVDGAVLQVCISTLNQVPFTPWSGHPVIWAKLDNILHLQHSSALFLCLGKQNI